MQIVSEFVNVFFRTHIIYSFRAAVRDYLLTNYSTRGEKSQVLSVHNLFAFSGFARVKSSIISKEHKEFSTRSYESSENPSFFMRQHSTHCSGSRTFVVQKTYKRRTFFIGGVRLPYAALQFVHTIFQPQTIEKCKSNLSPNCVKVMHFMLTCSYIYDTI